MFDIKLVKTLVDDEIEGCIWNSDWGFRGDGEVDGHSGALCGEWQDCNLDNVTCLFRRNVGDTNGYPGRTGGGLRRRTALAVIRDLRRGRSIRTFD
jgi:hypothetical protein